MNASGSVVIFPEIKNLTLRVKKQENAEDK